MDIQSNPLGPRKISVFLILLVSSIAVGGIVYSLMETAFRLPIAVVVSCLVFAVLLHLLGKEKTLLLSSNSRALLLVSRFRFQIIYAAAIAAVLVIPSMTSQLVVWDAIPFLSYVRLFLALLLSYLLPGLAMIKIICENRLSVMETIVFSFLASILLLAFIGANVNLVLTVNMILLVVSFYPALKHKASAVPEKRVINITETVILSSSFLLFALFSLSVYSTYWLFMGPDMWNHYGGALNIMNGIPEIPMVTRSYHTSIAGFLQLSGFPYINAWISSVFLLFVTVLAFYLMSTKLLSKLDKRAPIVSTIMWAFFAGFGWVYALFLQNTTQTDWLTTLSTTLGRTQLDIGYPPGYWTFMGDNPPAAIGFISLFAMVYLAQKRDLNNKAYVFLTTVTFAVGYFLHSVEILFFFIFLLVFFVTKQKINFKVLFSSLMLACSVILIYDYIYQTLFVGSFVQTKVWTLGLVIFLASAVGFALMLVPLKMRLSIKQFPIKTYVKNKISLFIALILFYICGLSIIIWLNIKDAYWWGDTLPFRFVPWYFYPITLGVVLIFAVASIAWQSNFKKEKGVYIFLLLSAFLLFLAGRLITFVNLNYFDTQFNESRVGSILFVPLSLLASLAFIFVFDKLSGLKVSPS